MEKTVLEWLTEAKEQGYEWADRAISAMTHFGWSLEFSLSDALFHAFTWEDTSEGFGYWSKIYHQLKNDGK